MRLVCALLIVGSAVVLLSHHPADAYWMLIAAIILDPKGNAHDR